MNNRVSSIKKIQTGFLVVEFSSLNQLQIFTEMYTNDIKHLPNLFERKLEPIFTRKSNFQFVVPEKFLSGKYNENIVKHHSDLSKSVENDNRIVVVECKVKSGDQLDLTIPKSLGRNEQFSVFNAKHRKIAGHLINIFMKSPSDELLCHAIQVREQVNPLLFTYALSVAMLHRSDTMHLPLLSMVQTYPEDFIPSNILREIYEQAAIVPIECREPIDIPATATDLDIEHRLWYFREDVGLNLHHWHWHLVYPHDCDTNVVDKDRRGELFYYLHKQIVARYNFERLCNKMAPVERFNNIRDPIPEAYFPKLASRDWMGRQENSRLHDLDRNESKNDVSDMELWINRFLDACHQGYIVMPQGPNIPLDEEKGIDILGNIMESSVLSKNHDFYGDLHNMGHDHISILHSLMGSNTTAMRDPIFYRWHAYVDHLFQQHKERLPPYNDQQLDYRNIDITDVVVQTGTDENTFRTCWEKTVVDISKGLDFFSNGPLTVRFTHLQNKDFVYRITYNNGTGSKTKGTCRIFLAPSYGFDGKKLKFEEQRHLMCEMDRFIIDMDIGLNTHEQCSKDSSITIPFDQTFPPLNGEPPARKDGSEFCGCGWPQHMLVPKGIDGTGFACDLFVMISNYDDDKIDQGPPDDRMCKNASSYCGLRDRLYPDKRAMGFPFDRVASGKKDLQDFIGSRKNMKFISCKIIHDGAQA